MIKVGVSACFLYPDKLRPVFGPKTLCYMERDMARFLSREKVMPLLIPDLEEPLLKEFVAEMDGFIFQGGTDIAPETYGEKPILPDQWHGDPYRDVYELKILNYAIENDKPVLGICRGFQLLNVYFGGSLYQDIEHFHLKPIKHRDAEIYDQLFHHVVFEKGKILERLHPDPDKNLVNSVHHQGIKKLGKDLEVLAYCMEDGMIEAFHWVKAPEGKVMGVQWHPEYLNDFQDQLIDARIIYDHFLSFCKS